MTPSNPPARRGRSPQPSLPKPPAVAQRWVRAMLGFGVSVVLGLLPLLGTVGVPGFTSLLSMFPQLPFDTTGSVIPIASFLMGAIAAAIQFYSADGVSKARIRRMMTRTIAVTGAALLLLLVVHTFSVEHKRVRSFEETTTVSVLLGFSRSPDCQECRSSMSNVECLDYTTLNPGRIRSCWGDRNINVAFILLAVLYLTVMGGFGVMVGLVTLRKG